MVDKKPKIDVNDYEVVGRNEELGTVITKGDIKRKNPNFISSWLSDENDKI